MANGRQQAVSCGCSTKLAAARVAARTATSRWWHLATGLLAVHRIRRPKLVLLLWRSSGVVRISVEKLDTNGIAQLSLAPLWRSSGGDRGATTTIGAVAMGGLGRIVDVMVAAKLRDEGGVVARRRNGGAGALINRAS
ncbi:hypothetical protein NL676_016996 [Syzygium grande]|nr:hypothetical protein NL676_016996 [Syzygium grande]